MKALYALLLLLSFPREARYFPNIVYGQILIGAGTSRYETVFTIVAARETRATLGVFTDRGEPMNASFVDAQGRRAGTGSSFECYLVARRPVQIRLGLAPDDAEEDVAVKTGWATVQSSEELAIEAVVRITTPDGRLLTRHVLASQKPPIGE
ncbi:MAG TPA: hypothetical protein VE422_32595 [Terriglobia bacterium]|nr:hypothetical protein [Terriglobia bacterium]